ncbi:Pre-mRNA-splicing factor SYF2 [Tilletia horrida]|uniref:Pre-mRNA-splicing factor SYF2 n=1 Tax=Tilletia horrida TaxID=155126 RepID=A0AAN6GUG5_9BASI|nr:Pre-mRNA-splicing factor SYF2 [Tilletia horrida]
MSQSAGNTNAAAPDAERRIPFHHITVSSCKKKLVLLLSAARVILLDHATGSVLGHLECPTTVPSAPYSSKNICFPRHAAISPDERYVVIVGDDKVVHVWDLDKEQQDGNQLSPGGEVLVRPVPKRANTIFWEQNSSYIVLGDRFGDVRCFPAQDPAFPSVETVLSRLAANVSNPKDAPKGIKQTTSGAADSDDEDGADPSDPWSSPRVGHTSMLTAAMLLESSSSTPSEHGGAARYIVTADRDEHIRVSRWGPKRAGWVVENYLMGSNAFVAALAHVPQSVVDKHFSGRTLDGSGHGLLLASDGGRLLRLWNYLHTDTSSQLVASVEVSAAVLPHVVVSGKTKNKQGGAKKTAPGYQSNVSEERIQEVEASQRTAEENSKLAITKLVVLRSKDEDQVVFTAEGSTAFFTLPISELSRSNGAEIVDVSAQIQKVDAGAAILDVEVDISDPTRPRLWATLDTLGLGLSRGDMEPAVKVYDLVDNHWVETEQASVALMESLRAADASRKSKLLQKVDPKDAKKISATYYDALKTYPKLAGESCSSLPMTSAGVYEVSPTVGTAAAKRKQNMDRIRAAAASKQSNGNGTPDVVQVSRKKIKSEPLDGPVFTIHAVDEQIGGGPRSKGKGKAVVDAETSADAADAEVVPVDQAAETEMAPDSNANISKVSMEDRMAKMKELRKKMNDSARANRKDVIAEQTRAKNGGVAKDPQHKSWKLKKAEKILEERDIRESGEDLDRVRAWGYSIEDNEAWEEKLEDKEERRDKGPVDFNTAAERSYQRQVRQMKPDLKEYERSMVDASNASGTSSSSSALVRSGQSSGALITTNSGTSTSSAYQDADALSYGTHKPSEAAFERLASHINHEHEVRATRSRKRPADPDSEVTYINEKNRKFNEKAERFFGKYTKEIRESFERGTAL